MIGWNVDLILRFSVNFLVTRKKNVLYVWRFIYFFFKKKDQKMPQTFWLTALFFFSMCCEKIYIAKTYLFTKLDQKMNGSVYYAIALFVSFAHKKLLLTKINERKWVAFVTLKQEDYVNSTSENLQQTTRLSNLFYRFFLSLFLLHINWGKRQPSIFFFFFEKRRKLCARITLYFRLQVWTSCLSNQSITTRGLFISLFILRWNCQLFFKIRN